MNKLNSKMRVTEVDSLSDALVRIYKADSKIQEDAFLKTVMDDVENLSYCHQTGQGFKQS